MALVKVTGNVWDHSRTVFPASLLPRLWFVPSRASAYAGLMSRVEVQATLTATTGAFTVWLENAPGVKYRPRLDWLIPGQQTEPAELRARGFDEWPFEFYPGPFGGPISELLQVDLTPWDVLVQLETPPPSFKGWWLHAGPGDPDNPAETGTGDLRRVF